MGRKRKQQKKQRQSASRKRQKQKQSKQGKALYQLHLKNFITKLSSAGLKIVEIYGDGNCLFRAISHQLTETEDLHMDFRAQCVAHLSENKTEYAPFLEENYEEYLESLANSGFWGGNLELYVMSHVLSVNIIVHRLDSPNNEIINFPEDSHSLHLSYHLGNHFNSIVSVTGDPIPIRPYISDNKPKLSHEEHVISYLLEVAEGKPRDAIVAALKRVFPDKLPELEVVCDHVDEILDEVELVEIPENTRR